MEGLLTGWKAIADFISVSERTAQTYEKTKGLPVIRLGRKSPVKAIESELSQWLVDNHKTA